MRKFHTWRMNTGKGENNLLIVKIGAKIHKAIN